MVEGFPCSIPWHCVWCGRIGDHIWKTENENNIYIHTVRNYHGLQNYTELQVTELHNYRTKLWSNNIHNRNLFATSLYTISVLAHAPSPTSFLQTEIHRLPNGSRKQCSIQGAYLTSGRWPRVSFCLAFVLGITNTVTWIDANVLFEQQPG